MPTQDNYCLWGSLSFDHVQPLLVRGPVVHLMVLVPGPKKGLLPRTLFRGLDFQGRFD